MSATLRQVLKSAARLQSVVPDAVLVGRSAAALHAGLRDCFFHDHSANQRFASGEEVPSAALESSIVIWTLREGN